MVCSANESIRYGKHCTNAQKYDANKEGFYVKCVIIVKTSYFEFYCKSRFRKTTRLTDFRNGMLKKGKNKQNLN